MSLRETGADSTISLDHPHEELVAAFRDAAGTKGFDVVIDYLWGAPTEALLKALTRVEFAATGPETRLVAVGESAGPTIALPSAVLRSTALTILGTAGMPPMDLLAEALRQVMNHAASGELRVDIEPVALKDIESAWQRDVRGRRLVVIP